MTAIFRMIIKNKNRPTKQDRTKHSANKKIEGPLPRVDSSIWLQARYKEVLGNSWWDALSAFSPDW